MHAHIQNEQKQRVKPHVKRAGNRRAYHCEHTLALGAEKRGARVEYVGLNALFLFVLNMGVLGVGLATLICRIVPAVFMLILLANITPLTGST